MTTEQNLREARMALKSIVGLDHVVVVVRDLAAAAEGWRRLGFAVSPRGAHSPLLGTANHTIMFGDDYIELLGILADTDYNAPSRALLAHEGEGIERTAFTAVDSAAGVDELRARGIPGVGPIDFGRPVTLPDGGRTEARFRVFQWPPTETPAGMRIFACQHLTREAVWVPELLRHANTAQRIVRLEIVSEDAEADAAHMARLIDVAALHEADAFTVPSGEGRADFLFLSPEALTRRHPGAPLDGLPRRGPAALVIAVDDLAATVRAAGSHATECGGRVYVPAARANRVLLCFVADEAAANPMR